jgi:hypothetical protein
MQHRARLLAALALVLGAVPAAAQQTAAATEFISAIDDDLLLRAFGALASDSMQGRRIASPGSLKARAFLVGELKRLGVEPLVPDFVSSFPARIPDVAATEQRRGATSILGRQQPSVVNTMRSATGSNILGVIRGTEHPDRFVVLSAHYDHVGINGGQVYPGANDNASGSAALLAIADLLVAAKPRNSVIIAFFDGEELGMLGSVAFAKNPPMSIKQIAANVNVDMVSRSDDGVLYLVGEKWNARMSAIASVVSSTGIVRIVGGHDGRDSKDDYTQRSDQWTFRERGIPAVLFTAEELADYHRPSDFAGKVNLGFYVRAVSAIADFVRQLDESIDESFLRRR